MCQQMDSYLDANDMSPDEARKMAGKCNFLTGRLFANDKPTRSSLLAVRAIIQHCRRTAIPRNPVAQIYSVIYTDAYFNLGQQIYRPGDEDLLDRNSTETNNTENAWAALCFDQGDVQGRLPSVPV